MFFIVIPPFLETDGVKAAEAAQLVGAQHVKAVHARGIDGNVAQIGTGADKGLLVEANFLCQGNKILFFFHDDNIVDISFVQLKHKGRL